MLLKKLKTLQNVLPKEIDGKCFMAYLRDMFAFMIILMETKHALLLVNARAIVLPMETEVKPNANLLI